MAKLWFIICLVTLLQQSLVPTQGSLIRISLDRVTKSQGGSLGQPVTSYYANIDVGTPAQQFKFLVDLDARETWIPHYVMLSGLSLHFQRLNYRNGYMKGSSSSSETEGRDYTIDYDSQMKLNGTNYEDLFEFKNVQEGPSPVGFRQRFLAVSAASSDSFGRRGVDGVLALNPHPTSETGSDSPLVALQRANPTSDLKFSLLLDSQAESTYDLSIRGGEIAFGQVESSANYVGPLQYHLVLDQQHWELNLQSVMLGSYQVSCLSKSCGAVLSTNQNDVSGPAQDVAKVIRMLGLIGSETEFNPKQLYEIDCSRVTSSPDLTFSIDGIHYVLKPEKYIQKKSKGGVTGPVICYVAIRATGANNKWQLGTNFLSNYYTVFDMDKRQVALARRR